MRLLSGRQIRVLSIYNADLHGECEEKRIASNLDLQGEVETRILEMFPRTILTVSAKTRRGFSVQDRASRYQSTLENGFGSVLPLGS
jgi:hypothetical protein